MDLEINFEKIDKYTKFAMSNFAGIDLLDSNLLKREIINKAMDEYAGQTFEFEFIFKQLEIYKYFKVNRNSTLTLLEKGKDYLQTGNPVLNNISIDVALHGDTNEEIANQLWSLIGPDDSLFRMSGPLYYKTIREFINILPPNLDRFLQLEQSRTHSSSKPSRSNYYITLFNLLDDDQIDNFLFKISNLISNRIDQKQTTYNLPTGQNVIDMQNLKDYISGYSEPSSTNRSKTAKVPHNNFSEKKYDPKKVFIVHGHDETLKTKVENALFKLGLSPIILHKQVNGGQTIIEKFESYAEDCGFAVVLLTSDDEGYAKNNHPFDNGQFFKDRIESRARQNVVFELGYFVGHLGRERVLALKDDDCCKPGDFDGIVYQSSRVDAEWKNRLVMELRNCKYDVDANKLLE